MAKQTENTKKKEAQAIGSPLSPRLLPLKQASQYSGLTIWCLRERIWAGELAVIQFNGGRKQYIDRVDLDKLIEESKKVIS